MDKIEAASIGWIGWNATIRTSAFIATVTLSAVWVVVGAWTVVNIGEAATSDTAIGPLVMLAVVVEVALGAWLASQPMLAYERWMLTLVDPSNNPAWTTRLSGSDAQLLLSVAEQPTKSKGAEWRGGLCVFTLARSEIVFWAVDAKRLRPVLGLPVDKIDSIWRRDLRPAATYLSFVDVDYQKFVTLLPGRGRLRRLIRDREDGFRAIARLVGPARVRTTEVRRD